MVDQLFASLRNHGPSRKATGGNLLGSGILEGGADHHAGPADNLRAAVDQRTGSPPAGPADNLRAAVDQRTGCHAAERNNLGAATLDGTSGGPAGIENDLKSA